MRAIDWQKVSCFLVRSSMGKAQMYVVMLRRLIWLEHRSYVRIKMKVI